mmetsp:Transcript_51888/g.167055  ORF Transcript_51888/g.167055 Transcript_51888/m.167055 type:complete len:142 (+) Transcript_51888:213-638(+)
MGADFLQPALLAFGMAALPFNLAWWGNSTLGCYVFHFYFKEQVGMWAWSLCDFVAWDPTGLLAFFLIIGLCMIFTSVLGPAGHYLLLSPVLLYPRVKSLISAAAATAQRQKTMRCCFLIFLGSSPVLLGPALSALAITLRG